MHWKFALNRFKICQSLISLSLVLWATPSYAQKLVCPFKAKPRLLCNAETLKQKQQLNQLLFNTYLSTNAPPRLIIDTQILWQKRIQQCKNKRCIQQQFETRSDDLNSYSSLNQNLTQHFIQYKNGQTADPQVHLQIHQLDQNRIKIEGIAYRNPNNHRNKQSVAFLAYQNQDQKNQVTNNETACQYGFNFQKAILTIRLIKNQPHQSCDRFVGNYRLYD
ncbi:A1S_1983 family putative colistin resistance protein [Acinetobacter sp. MD2]|uniref:A1S_1983 family putative colistin resistance protein n=1 Tax=Acinetobacter sp. MD2 TaxID=2600066 RepID=UPI002D1F5529|nr:hypothetical protein [Acinetobacter sp. MD2]MEB3766307.1 hypothetical protein [Acinetobacter sp. MD2]